MSKAIGIAMLAFLACGQVQIVICDRVQAQTTQDRRSEADRLINLGNQQFNKSLYRESLQSYQLALDIYRAIKDRKGEGNSLNNLGNTYDSLGQYQKAIDFFQQSLTIAKQIGDLYSEGRVLRAC
jgi:tetratricopeptide (TPR) repeat protein